MKAFRVLEAPCNIIGETYSVKYTENWDRGFVAYGSVGGLLADHPYELGVTRYCEVELAGAKDHGDKITGDTMTIIRELGLNDLILMNGGNPVEALISNGDGTYETARFDKTGRV